MNDDVCRFCGAPAKHWEMRGGGSWAATCDSDVCWQRQRWATWEPKLLPWMDPTPAQCFVGWLLYWTLGQLWRVIPAGWLIDVGGMRERIAIWAYSNSYFWGERAEGRV